MPFTVVYLTNITKHNSTNYLAWKTQAKITLNGYALYKFVDGTHPSPAPTISGWNEIVFPNPAFLAWQCQDQLLHGALLETLSNSTVNLVTQVTTGKGVWDLLQQAYAIASRGHKKSLKANLGAMKKGSSSIGDNMQNMKASVDLLASLGAPISQEDLIKSILKGLDSAYQSVIDEVNNRETSISFHELHEKLILKELDLKTEITTDGSPASALITQSKSRKKKKVSNAASSCQPLHHPPQPPYN